MAKKLKTQDSKLGKTPKREKNTCQNKVYYCCRIFINIYKKYRRSDQKEAFNINQLSFRKITELKKGLQQITKYQILLNRLQQPRFWLFLNRLLQLQRQGIFQTRNQINPQILTEIDMSRIQKKNEENLILVISKLDKSLKAINQKKRVFHILLTIRIHLPKLKLHPSEIDKLLKDVYSQNAFNAITKLEKYKGLSQYQILLEVIEKHPDVLKLLASLSRLAILNIYGQVSYLRDEYAYSKNIQEFGRNIQDLQRKYCKNDEEQEQYDYKQQKNGAQTTKKSDYMRKKDDPYYQKYRGPSSDSQAEVD